MFNPEVFRFLAVTVPLTVNGLLGNGSPACLDVVNRQMVETNEGNPNLMQLSDSYRRRPHHVLEGLERAVRYGDVETVAFLSTAYDSMDVVQANLVDRWSTTLKIRSQDPNAVDFSRDIASQYGSATDTACSIP